MTLSTLFDKNIIVGQDFTILSKAEGLAVLTLATYNRQEHKVPDPSAPPFIVGINKI